MNGSVAAPDVLQLMAVAEAECRCWEQANVVVVLTHSVIPVILGAVPCTAALYSVSQSVACSDANVLQTDRPVI